MMIEGALNVRKAQMEDLPAVCRIVREATRHMDEHGVLQWDNIYPSEAILRGDIAEGQMRLIEVGGRPAGLIVINEEESPEYSDVAWLYSGRAMVVHRLTIDPPFQRRGLASRLMDFAEELAVVEGYGCIRLDAFTQNSGAVALYEDRGYRRAGAVCFRKGRFFCYEKQASRTASYDVNGKNSDSRTEPPPGTVA